MVSIIAAVAQNNVIGRGGKLPWNIPEDMRYFKEKTIGNIVIMGRKTYESIGSPLPNRVNIAVTSHKVDGDVIAAESLEKAIKIAEEISQNSKEIFLCGGEQIYSEGLKFAQRLYLTQVKSEYEGDAFFPEFDKTQFVLKRCEEHEGFSFCIYEKK